MSSDFNSRSLGPFTHLSWHGRGFVRMGEAWTNNKGKFIPGQKTQCKRPTEHINMQSGLTSSPSWILFQFLFSKLIIPVHGKSSLSRGGRRL